MIYIFDKKQKINKVFTNEDLTAGHLDFKLNTATTFEFSVPANKALPSGSKYVAVPHPLDDSKFVFLRLTERVDKTDTVDYSAYELAYQELQSYGYISDKRPKDADALTLMKTALNGTNWELNKVNVAGKASTSFYYVDHLTAISSVVDLLGGEIVFYVEIQGNTISGRYMDYLARQGKDTSKVFAKGSNLLTVERQTDMSSVYTAILPRGKGVQVSGQEDEETPDGYGRRLNIADVEWKKSNGKPLDKAKGSLILGDPDANKEWGHIDGQYRLLLQNYDDVDNVNVLINSAYKTLKSVNHPQIQYSATVADVGGLSLGDTVLIMHGERNLSYKTRVFEVNYDLLAPDQTEISLGDDLTENSIASQVITLGSSQNILSEQTQWTVAQVGREPLYFGSDYPEHPKIGDIFFKYLPNGDTVVYRWNGTIWEELVSSNTAAEISDAVDDAIKKANDYTDELNEKQAEEVQKFQSEANSALSEAAAERNSLSIQADTMLDSANSYADSMAGSAAAYGKAQASNVLSQAQSELSVAKQQLGSEVSKAQSDITATNKQLAGKVSQTDFDKTTGDLSTKYGQIKATADAVTTDVAKYKQTNDKKVSANIASIATMSDQITSKVSKTDLDKATGELNGKFTQQQQTVDSISQTVTELQAKANSQGQVNQLMNTEFNPDLEGWMTDSTDGSKVPYRSYARGGAGSITVGFNSTSASTGSSIRLIQTVMLADGTGRTISLRWLARTLQNDNYDNVRLLFRDADNKDISDAYRQWADTTMDGKWHDIKWENIEVPDDAVTVTLYFQAREGTRAYLNQPMLVFDKTIGDYVQGNYNNNNRVAELEVGIDHITGLVNDPKNGLSATANLAANGLSVATKAQNDATTAVQTANGIQINVESMGKINQLLNTEFNPDLQGWTVSSSDSKHDPYRSYIPENIGSRSVRFGTEDAPSGYYSRLSQNIDLSTGNGGVLSMSWQVRTVQNDNYTNLWLEFLDSEGTQLSSTNVKWSDENKDGAWHEKKWENVSIPSDARQVTVSFESREGTSQFLVHPMVVFDKSAGVYSQGNYNNNNLVESIRTQLADQITDEIKNRKTGDSSTVTQLTGLIDQRITSVTKGYQSAITQSANGIMASMSVPNQLLNTEFSPDLDGWTTATTGSTKVPYQSYWNTYNQARTVAFNTTSGASSSYSRMYQNVQLASTTGSGNSISLLWSARATQLDNYANLWVDFYDGSNNKIDRQVKKWVTIADGSWSDSKWENISVPDSAVNVTISFEAREGTVAYLSHPMLVLGATVGTYMPGSYSGMNTSTVLELFKDNWALGIADNSGKLISGINGDTSGTVIQGKKLVINSDTTITGKAFINGAVIKDGSISHAQIGNAAIGSAQIINVDVSKISGNIANFITANVNTLNAKVLYGDTGHLGTTDTGRVINKQDNHLQLASKGMYNSANDRAQVELLSHTNDIDANMRGSFNYYSDVRKGHGLGIRLVQNQILAIDEDGGSKNLYLSPYAGGQVRIVSRDLNSYYDIAAANFRVSSQRKFKSDIKPLDDGALDIVNKTNIKSYTKNGVSEIGVIADEAPNEVLSDDGKFINIYDYTSVLYKAVQELSAQVKELQNERPNN